MDDYVDLIRSLSILSDEYGVCGDAVDAIETLLATQASLETSLMVSRARAQEPETTPQENDDLLRFVKRLAAFEMTSKLECGDLARDPTTQELEDAFEVLSWVILEARKLVERHNGSDDRHCAGVS